MSMHEIVYYGFGVDTSEKFDFKNLKSFQEAIALCGEDFKNGWLTEALDEAKNRCREEIGLRDEDITERHLFNYLPYERELPDTGVCATVAEAVLQNIILTQENVNVDVIAEDGVRAVMLLECMPWANNETERNLTYDKLEEIFKKYCGIISGDTILDIDYQEIETVG